MFGWLRTICAVLHELRRWGQLGEHPPDRLGCLANEQIDELPR